jgi:hypothetical protein
VAARSKAWVCGHSLAGVGISNTIRSTDVCLVGVLCIVKYRSLRRADHSSRGVPPRVECLRVIEVRHRGGLDQLGLSYCGGGGGGSDQISRNRQNLIVSLI